MDRAKLAKIHIAKKELALTDEAYRDILRLHFQAESAKELNDRQGTVLINLFRAKGWKPTERPEAKRAPRPRRSSTYIDIPEGGPAAQQQRMRARGGTAVARAGQCGQTRADGGVQVRAGGGDHARGEG